MIGMKIGSNLLKESVFIQYGDRLDQGNDGISKVVRSPRTIQLVYGVQVSLTFAQLKRK